MHKAKTSSLFILLLAVILAGSASASSWNVDGSHTEVNFSVSHFFTPVTGRFEDFDVKLNYDQENPEKSRIEAKIKVASINTGNEQRDEHLRSADWFDAAKYPYMTFKSTSVRQQGDTLIARGDLTIKGQTQEVEMPISLLGVRQIPEQMRPMLGGADEVASFKAATSLSRGDYGVGVGNWAATMVVGGEVGVEILLEAHRK